MRPRYRSNDSIIAWQKTPEWRENLTRVARGTLSISLWLLQLPLIALEIVAGTTFYGRPSWNFSFRALRLLGFYAAWSLNPGARPVEDVFDRQRVGKLKKGQHASLIEVPARPDKIHGDATFETVIPEPCPCFWQWLESMPSPLTDPTPMSDRKVMMYFVGGGMIQGHPVTSPLPWKMMEVSQIAVFGVNFRKCVTKETAFPAALQDAVASFFFLLEQGFKSENVIISGDSGGGGIVLTTLLYLVRHHLPVPGASILVSPFTSLVEDDFTNEELFNLDALNVEMCSMVSYQYTENRPELRATLLSPSQGKLPQGYTFTGFPKTLITYGDAEIFSPAIIKLIGNLREFGVKVEVSVGKDQIHDYPYYTKDRSHGGFFGRMKPFLNGEGRY